MPRLIVKIVFLLAVLSPPLLVQPAHCEEPARAFLNGLRARGYQDIAIEYLNQMQTSRLAPPEIKNAILYEKSILLIDVSRTQRDSKLRVQQINQAQKWLQEFIDAQGSSPRANAARNQLGSLLVERARMKSEDAKKDNNAKLKKESRSLYEQSFKVFGDLQAQVDKQLSAIPKVLDTRDRKQAKLIERRKQLRADFLQTELFAAAIREELADQLPAGSADQTKLFAEAASMYEGIYKKYRTRLAGLYARLYQGRCNERLGKTKDALGFFSELLDQPSEPESMLTLKAKTLRRAMEAWLSPSEKKYMEAIKRASNWFDESPRGKEREADWLAIRYSLAKAYKMQADDAKRTEPVDKALIRRSLDAAKQQLALVASESGDFQEPAQKLLEQLGGPAVGDEEVVISTFEAAQAAAKEALDSFGPATKAIQSAQQKLAAAKDPAGKSTLETQLANAQAKLTTAQDDAVKYYKLAIELADDSTPQSNVNLARYFLTYVYYVRQDYWRAALVGNFVARRFPDSPGARQCAKIAMACHLKMLEENGDDESVFEVQQLVTAGEMISGNWPGTKDTEDSLASLIPVLINAGETLQAAEFVKKVPAKSNRRGELEFVTGQSIWGAYLAGDQKSREWRASGAPEDIDLQAHDQQQAKFKQSAEKLLADGFKRLPADPLVSVSNATAMLSLAQVHVENGEFADAVNVVEHDVLGPLTLVRQSSDATSNPIFVEETYRTALRSYVGSLGGGGQGMMEKAQGVMKEMQAALGDDEAGKQRMLGVYVSLAQDVERGMKSATPEAREQMSEVFEAFLLELSQGSSELSVLNWVAETFASLGAGFEGGDQPNANATKYFQRSATAFENILSQPSLSPEMKTQATARLAAMSAKSGDRDKALGLYKEVLAENANAINVQVAVAELLQAWGEQDANKFVEAVNGDKPTIWGWAKIALTAARAKQFRATFFQARYEMANCQHALAQSKSGAEQKKLVSDAEKTILKTVGLYPTLGGEEMHAKYDALLKKIQQASGKAATGLPKREPAKNAG